MNTVQPLPLQAGLTLLIMCATTTHAMSGERIYQYDAGCATFSVHEQLPEVVGGVADGPAVHTLHVQSSQPGAILDGVAIEEAEAENISPASFGSAFSEGFVELSRVPGGIAMVVTADDPAQPFSWRISARCHHGAIGLLHYDKIHSTRPRQLPADVAHVDDILLGKPAQPVLSPASSPAATRPAPQRSGLDAELAALASGGGAADMPRAANDPLADDLLAAANSRTLRERDRRRQAATADVERRRSTFLAEAGAVARRHLAKQLEANRREQERQIADQERAEKKKKDRALMKGLAFGAAAGLGAYKAGYANAGRIGGDFGTRIAQGNTGAALQGLNTDLASGQRIDWKQTPPGYGNASTSSSAYTGGSSAGNTKFGGMSPNLTSFPGSSASSTGITASPGNGADACAMAGHYFGPGAIKSEITLGAGCSGGRYCIQTTDPDLGWNGDNAWHCDHPEVRRQGYAIDISQWARHGSTLTVTGSDGRKKSFSIRNIGTMKNCINEMCPQ